MCTTALSCVQGGMLVVKKAAVAHLLSVLGRRTSAPPSPVILKTWGAISRGDTLCHDALPAGFRATSVFCGNATGCSAVKDELNFARKLGI